MRYYGYYRTMFKWGCHPLNEAKGELARAIVVVQLEIHVRTGQIQIQRTFFTPETSVS